MSDNPSNASRGRVFLAEDDDEMRELLELALTSSGFAVVAVARGDELLECLAIERDGSRPDVVVTDLRMPGRDGLSVVAEVRKRYPQLPILLITAFGDDAVHRRARELGASRVLDKPIALDELRDALTQMTGG